MVMLPTKFVSVVILLTPTGVFLGKSNKYLLLVFLVRHHVICNCMYIFNQYVDGWNFTNKAHFTHMNYLLNHTIPQLSPFSDINVLFILVRVQLWLHKYIHISWLVYTFREIIVKCFKHDNNRLEFPYISTIFRIQTLQNIFSLYGITYWPHILYQNKTFKIIRTSANP